MPTCNNCGGDFHSFRSDALYCSGACRVAAHRASKSLRSPSVTHKVITDGVVDRNQIVDVPFRDITSPSPPYGGPVVHQLTDQRRSKGKVKIHPVIAIAAHMGAGSFEDYSGDEEDWPEPPSAPAPVAPRTASRAVTVIPQRPPAPSIGEICQALLMAATRLPVLNKPPVPAHVQDDFENNPEATGMEYGRNTGLQGGGNSYVRDDYGEPVFEGRSSDSEPDEIEHEHRVRGPEDWARDAADYERRRSKSLNVQKVQKVQEVQKPEPEPEPEPSWWYRHLATPKKAVWR